MKRFFLLSSCLFLLLLQVSCSSVSTDNGVDAWIEDKNRVRVLTTIEMLSEIVKQIGGEHVNCITLIKRDLDPHTYELVKGDDEKFANADLVVYNGLGLEHGPSLHRQLEEMSNSVAVGDIILKKDPALILWMSGMPDPHIWMDISLWMHGVGSVTEALAAIDPSHAKDYKSNSEKLLKQMQDAHNKIRDTLQSIPAEKRFLVTIHDAFFYFTRAYLASDSEKGNDGWRKRFEAPEGLAPDAQLSSVDIRRLIDHISKYKIKTIFPEFYINRDSIKKIESSAKEMGIDVKIASKPLYGDSMGDLGTPGETYLGMLLYNAETIHETIMNSSGK